MKTSPALVGRLSNARQACVSDLGVIIDGPGDSYRLNRSELRNLIALAGEFEAQAQEASDAAQRDEGLGLGHEADTTTFNAGAAA